MTLRPNSCLAFLVASWLVGSSTAVWALKPDNITDAEMAVLPRFCPDSQTFKQLDQVNYSPATRMWVDAMGLGFFHVHHYCWARINFQRAQRARISRYDREFILKDVRGDFWYVVNNAGPDFVLLPELYTWIGRSSVLLDDSKAANEAFAKARSLKPDYWPAYFHWAEYLRAKGKKAEAMEMVRSGLQNAPGAKALLLLYSNLGGKPADIPPPLPKPEESPEQPAPAQADSSPAPQTGSQNQSP
jgi:tetratricopeptide (TPR) repeat protein